MAQVVSHERSASSPKIELRAVEEVTGGDDRMRHYDNVNNGG